MDASNKLDQLKEMLRDRGVEIGDNDTIEDGAPSTRIAEAAIDELMVAGGGGTAWISWTRGVKQVSGGCSGTPTA